MGNLIQWLKTDIFKVHFHFDNLPRFGTRGIGFLRPKQVWEVVGKPGRSNHLGKDWIDTVHPLPNPNPSALMGVSLSTSQIQSCPQTWKRSFDLFHLFWTAPPWSLGYVPMKPSISIGSRLTSALSTSAMKQQGLSSWDKSCLVLCGLFPFSLKHQQQPKFKLLKCQKDSERMATHPKCSKYRSGCWHSLQLQLLSSDEV